MYKSTTSWCIGRHYVLLITCRHYVLLITCLLAFTSAVAQKTLQGTVTAESQSLPGVSVVVKGTTQGTTTDAEGKFTLATTPTAATLVFS